jgi:hypothetical protein
LPVSRSANSGDCAVDCSLTFDPSGDC